jgi:hypothetical protein
VANLTLEIVHPLTLQPLPRDRATSAKADPSLACFIFRFLGDPKACRAPGKTPVLTEDQARRLLASIKVVRKVALPTALQTRAASAGSNAGSSIVR